MLIKGLLADFTFPMSGPRFLNPCLVWDFGTIIHELGEFMDPSGLVKNKTTPEANTRSPRPPGHRRSPKDGRATAHGIRPGMNKTAPLVAYIQVNPT